MARYGRNTLVPCDGEIRTVREWARIANQSCDRIVRRLNAGWDIHKAIFTPRRNCGVYTGQCLRDNKLYSVWNVMRQRCYNPNYSDYKFYGARGITICDEWADFQTFFDWAMTHGYKDGYDLDRIDNNGNYSPDNCRFVTHKENCNNKRNTASFSMNGQTKTMRQWADEYGIPRSVLYQRLYIGWSEIAALTTPVKHYHRAGD